MTLTEIVRRFEGATRIGSGYRVRCPSHTDEKPSLSINEQDDKILMYCHAGCHTDAILRATNLTPADLFTHTNGNGHKSHVVATYGYHDVAGNLLYRKQRTAAKKFWFERPDGGGGWVRNTDGVEHVLYRLHDLREQAEGAAETFCAWVVEGEKDANRLWSLGLPATTNDVGASKDGAKPKWTDALTQQLKSVGVTDAVCLPDNDDPGRAHMQAVAASCHAAGIAVRVVELPGEHPKGYDVSNWTDDGHTLSELLELADAAVVYAPPEPTADAVTNASEVPYTFTHAFPAGHFVTKWIDHFRTQCDASLEFHEAAALVSLAAATPSLTARVSGSADGLRSNLYILLIGDPGRSRKSTAKDYSVLTVRRALPGVLLPEQMTQESFVESLTLCNGGAALWAIDEFTDTLSKIANTPHLAGLRGLLLELYARTDYTYRRVSKGAKKHEDHFAIRNVTLSLIGCATPTLFQHLDGTAVGSGLLTRFVIVMPDGKPPRLPQYALHEDAIPNEFVQWLHHISTRRQKVVFEEGVLEALDEAIDRPLDESDDRCQMTVRMGVMARKVAMLAAAGQPERFSLGDRPAQTIDAGDHSSFSQAEHTPLVVTLQDAESAIRVVRRWIAYALAFEARTEETSFEVKVQKCLSIVKGRTVNRREVSRRVHVPAKELTEIEKTLEQREQIEVITQKPATGRSAVYWKWMG